jgi:predicted GNAT family acetyltransferase
MLSKLDKNDGVLNRGDFVADEVKYNLIHLISGRDTSTCLTSDDGKLIYAHSEGHHAWLWISEVADEEKKNSLMLKLIEYLKGIGTVLPGVTGDPRTVEPFARLYAEAHNLQVTPRLGMESYVCPAVVKPRVRGALRQATPQDAETVASFMAGFSLDAYGAAVEPASQLPAAQGIIGAGGLYLWTIEGEERPVSMANIAHRSPRHARINAVYTPRDCRKQGYASALVAELCSILEAEGLTPMLYADLKNPDSNKVYQNIGFVESGIIAELKFGSR